MCIRTDIICIYTKCRSKMLYFRLHKVADLKSKKNMVLIPHINLFLWRSHKKIYLLKLHTRSVDLLVCFLVVHTPKSKSRLGFALASLVENRPNV
jgi:hypothetical protein